MMKKPVSRKIEQLPRAGRVKVLITLLSTGVYDMSWQKENTKVVEKVYNAIQRSGLGNNKK